MLFSLIYGATVFAITTPGLVPADILWYGQAANIPMIVLGKMIQVIANFKQGHTGQLSAVTIFLLTLGSLGKFHSVKLKTIFHLDFTCNQLFPFFPSSCFYFNSRNWRYSCNFNLHLFFNGQFDVSQSSHLLLESQS